MVKLLTVFTKKDVMAAKFRLNIITDKILTKVNCRKQSKSTISYKFLCIKIYMDFNNSFQVIHTYSGVIIIGWWKIEI